MPPRVIDRFKTIPIRHSLAVFVITGIALLATFFVDVTVIVHSPNIGNVSQILGNATKVAATGITLVAGAITIYNAVSGSEMNGADTGDTMNVSEGPADTITVDGDLYQINADNVTFGQDGEFDTAESIEEDEEESTEDESTRD